MIKQTKQVHEFHEKFNIEESKTPSLIDFDEYILRYDLMEEENKEYKEACLNRDLVEVADALGDQLYILCGTILKHGLQHKIEEVFNEIHRSNLSKLDKNGKPIYRNDGKVLKGENYFKPNLEPIVYGNVEK